MNLMMLMKDASIPDISGVPGLILDTGNQDHRRERILNAIIHCLVNSYPNEVVFTTGRPEDPERQLYKFWERFHLEMSNEEAYAHMQSLIIQSQTAFVPQMVEWAHKLKQDYLS